jgi:glycosyltransferase involved in cell wall biosynthesis
MQKVVPIGIWNNKIRKLPFSKIKRHQLFFVGHLLEKQGVQEVLGAIPLIVEKIPDFKFLIVGGGIYQNFLKKIAAAFGIEQYVEFKGWVKERNVLDSVMSQSALAIAPYKPEKEQIYNFTYYADPTKIKDYLGAGLPVILTDVPYNAKEIERKRCGIIIRYKKEDIASAIITLLSSDRILKEYRRNALMYAKEFDWEKIFDNVLG